MSPALRSSSNVVGEARFDRGDTEDDNLFEDALACVHLGGKQLAADLASRLASKRSENVAAEGDGNQLRCLRRKNNISKRIRNDEERRSCSLGTWGAP